MKQDVLDYLRYTPANTNVNVVSTMLDQNNKIPQDEELLHIFMEEDLVQPLVNEEDTLFVDKDGKIFVY